MRRRRRSSTSLWRWNVLPPLPFGGFDHQRPLRPCDTQHHASSARRGSLRDEGAAVVLVLRERRQGRAVGASGLRYTGWVREEREHAGEAGAPTHTP